MNSNATTAVPNEQLRSVLDNISKGYRSILELPGKSFIHLEPNLPFLLVYRITDQRDLGTKRLVKSAASFLILDNSVDYDYRKLLTEICRAMIKKHKAFLVMDVFSGIKESTTFRIMAPVDKMPASTQALKHELNKIKTAPNVKNVDVTLTNSQTKLPAVENLPYCNKDIEDAGAVLIGLEVPPVYRDKNEMLFPVYYRRFRDSFSRAVQKSIFEFIRVQTSCGIPSYTAIGKRSVHEKLYQLDKDLTEIESSFDLLMLIAPTNINQIRDTFFESGYQKVLDYHYRLLPIDPDRLKRDLFNLPIDQIDDPALSYLYNEKREELDKQLSMLRERGTRNFFYSSIRLFHGVEKDLKKEAEDILSVLQEEPELDEEDLIGADEFREMSRAEFEFFRTQDPDFNSKVHIIENLNIMMVSKGEFYLPKNYTLSRKEAEALLQHEIGTHVLTYYNGSKQPLTQMKAGLADYDTMQEGLAVMAEFLCGKLTPNRLRILAGRVIAGDALVQGYDFKSMFDLLKNNYGFSQDRAFNIVSRMFQGGGFLKDIIYLKGFVQLRHYLNSGGDLEVLLAGKFGLHHVNIIKELIDRGVLIGPVLKPRYLQMDCYKDQMKEITAGTYLAQMIKK